VTSIPKGCSRYSTVKQTSLALEFILQILLSKTSFTEGLLLHDIHCYLQINLQTKKHRQAAVFISWVVPSV